MFEEFDEDMIKFYNELNDFIAEKVQNGTNQSIIAPILNLLAYKIYKTILEQIEYDDMCKFIYESRNNIEPLITVNKEGTLH